MPGGLSAHQSPNGPLAAGSVVGRAPCGAEVRHSWGAGSCSGLGCCSGYKKGAERDKKQYSAAQLSSSKPATSRRERHRVRKRKIQSKDEPQPREDFVVPPTLWGVHHLLLLHCPAGEGVKPIASPAPAARRQLLPLSRGLSCQRHGNGTKGHLLLPQAPDGKVSST